MKKMKKIKQKSTTLSTLLKKNKIFISKYEKSHLLKFLDNPKITTIKHRKKLFECIQVLSNYFQKVVMLRDVFCEINEFMNVTQNHLKEEFYHNLLLMKYRHNQPPKWDPILEATSSWFAWKMFTLDNEEKAVLVHLVLEASANIFFKKALPVMKKYGDTDYFQIHSEVDADHENMATDLLKNLSAEKYKRLMEIQQQGWDVLNAVGDRIVNLSS